MTRKQSHCCEQQEPEKCCVPCFLLFNSELFLSSLSWPLLQPPLCLPPPPRGLLRGRVQPICQIWQGRWQRIYQVTSTTNSSQQLEARGFLIWHRVRTLCTDSAHSDLKPHVTGSLNQHNHSGLHQCLVCSKGVAYPTSQGRFWLSLCCVSVAEGFSNASGAAQTL